MKLPSYTPNSLQEKRQINGGRSWTKKKTAHWSQVCSFLSHAKTGLIIIDEEHEGSFKQEEKLKYNARDSAVMLAKFEDCPIILGSATPSLESWQNAITGKYQLISMKKRVLKRPFPKMEIVNPREDKDQQLPYWLSTTLYKKLKDNYENQLQSALFINRKGNGSFCPMSLLWFYLYMPKLRHFPHSPRPKTFGLPLLRLSPPAG